MYMSPEFLHVSFQKILSGYFWLNFVKFGNSKLVKVFLFCIRISKYDIKVKCNLTSHCLVREQSCHESLVLIYTSTPLDYTPCVAFKPSIWSNHIYTRWLKWKLPREDKLSMVNSS